jgi:hypothetical protein
MSKIIYLIDQPLDDRNFERFGIQAWIARGWAVEVWDLTALACPRAWENFVESGIKLAVFVGYFSIASKGELDCRFSKLEKVKYYIDLAGNGYRLIRVKMHFARLGAIRVICATGSIPTPVDNGECGFACKLRKAFTERPIKSLFGRITNACVSRLAAPFIRPGMIIASGEKSVPSAEHSQDVLRAHNFDYDIYLKLRKSIKASSAGYAVFLDQNMCFHPEFIYENVPNYATPEKYFPTICSGLRTIADALGAPMRIAAHPRLSRQRKYIDYFEGIPIEFGKTAELIGNCTFVVCHFTTAMQFAVLFRKPVIFVTTDELISSAAEKHIEEFASSLGKSVINLDGELGSVDWRKQLHIDAQKYDEYKNKYVKTNGSPEIPHWDIVIDHLEKVCGRLSADPRKLEARASGGG